MVDASSLTSWLEGIEELVELVDCLVWKGPVCGLSDEPLEESFQPRGVFSWKEEVDDVLDWDWSRGDDFGVHGVESARGVDWSLRDDWLHGDVSVPVAKLCLDRWIGGCHWNPLGPTPGGAFCTGVIGACITNPAGIGIISSSSSWNRLENR